VSGLQLTSMILRVFSNLNDSMTCETIGIVAAVLSLHELHLLQFVM